jgi:hypothetical protein
MTTLAKIEANRRNAKLSTGPRTPAGKAAVARNPVRHGVFAHLPVVPGENPYDWDRHRAGVVASLAPVGLLERTLAERVALLLWRLARLARFEAGTTAAAVEDAGLLPPEAEAVTAFFYTPTTTTDDYLKATKQQLRLARVECAETRAAADLLRRLGEAGGPDACPGETVVRLLGVAWGESHDYAFRRFEPDHPSGPAFLGAIGAAGADARGVAWTPELVLRGLAYYAGAAGAAPADFRAHVQTSVDDRVGALEREVGQLEADAAAIVRRVEGRRARAADAALLPREQAAERVMKYERHLHGQLTSTLHELERLQARRGGAAIVPPVVADVHLTVTPGLG